MFRFRPLGDWPGTATPVDERRKGHFTAKFENVLKSLEDELEYLAARDVVIEAAVRESEIRILDGGLRGDARPKHSGIVLSFASKYGPLRLPCDYFREWRDNLRAIALHLQNLRYAGLYGVGRHGEVYKGWNALPPARALVTPPAMTVEDAARFIAGRVASGSAEAARNIVQSADTFRSCYRAAAVDLHPDHNNSVVSENWQRLQEAKAVLDRHHQQQGATHAQ